MQPDEATLPHVVIIGGGFAGLNTAKRLGGKSVCVTLLDRRNIHLFQPLLYQVATGGLSPGDIVSPLRGVLKRHRNVSVLMTEVSGIDASQKTIVHTHGCITYDYLVVAGGTENFYFGHDAWAAHAPGLKTIEDALEIRRRILLAFEAAEVSQTEEAQKAWMTFVIVGGGPTGVELAGALAELARSTLRRNFRRINPARARIHLVEGGEQLLPQYPADLAGEAVHTLDRLGVSVGTSTQVTNVTARGVDVVRQGRGERIPARTVLWAAGVKPSGLSELLTSTTGCALENGRVRVEKDLSVQGDPEIFVAGDLAYVEDEEGNPLPGIAPVAMQQGVHVARTILARVEGREPAAFHYRDKGSLAVIGRNAAVARFPGISLSGFFAWLMWAVVHIYYLIDFDNKLLVFIQWSINYFTRKRGARLISGEDSHKALGS